MAESFSHKWGQIIGNLIQELICEKFQEVANEHGLYLDFQKNRRARTGKKVSWKDRYGNFHDLDYVFERGGTETTLGLPAAFIETAWRRYTKHSRNKAQEIEGALVPLAETYSHLSPFLGVVLAGVFTKGSLNQLQSKGFEILYLEYNSLIQAFTAVGIDASFDQNTAELEFQNKITQWNNLSTQDIAEIKNQLLSTEKAKIDNFIAVLVESFSRQILGLTVNVLHGIPQQIATIEQAIEYLHNYSETQSTIAPASKYEINIRYNNGDIINAIVQNKNEAIKFLRTFA